jgi:hypothetical protein
MPVNLVSDDLPKLSSLRVVEAWSYRSDSRAATYEVTLWDNAYISCTCAGWVFARKTNLEKFGYKRWCKHVAESWSNAELAYLTYTGGKPAQPPRSRNLRDEDEEARADVPGLSRRRAKPAPVAADEEPVQFADKDNKGRRVLAKTENISLRPTRAFDV